MRRHKSQYPLRIFVRRTRLDCKTYQKPQGILRFMGTLALGAVRKLGGGVLVEVSICFGCALVVLWCFYVMILSRETGGVGDTILFSGKI